MLSLKKSIVRIGVVFVFTFIVAEAAIISPVTATEQQSMSPFMYSA